MEGHSELQSALRERKIQGPPPGTQGSLGDVDHIRKGLEKILETFQPSFFLGIILSRLKGNLSWLG